MDHFAVIDSRWAEEQVILPHEQNLFGPPYFKGVKTQLLPERSYVDILIGLDNSELMMVLDEF